MELYTKTKFHEDIGCAIIKAMFFSLKPDGQDEIGIVDEQNH